MKGVYMKKWNASEYTLFCYKYSLENIKYSIGYLGMCWYECYSDRQDIHHTGRNNLLILVSNPFTLRKFSYLHLWY